MIKSTMRSTLRKTQKGLTTVEYAIAGGLISGLLIVAFNALGLSIQGVVNAIAVALNGVAGGI